MIWYMIYDMIWHGMTWHNIIYHIISYISYHIIYHISYIIYDVMWCDVIWYDIPHNISVWHDTGMMTYDARIVYYCNGSIWYQDEIYQYYMMYQCDMIYQLDMTRQQWYDISIWHDTTAVWYNIWNLCNWYHDFSVFWPFGVLALRCSGVRGFDQTIRSYCRDYSYERFRTTKRVRYCQGEVSPRNECAMIRHMFALASCVYLLLRFRGVNAGTFYHCHFQ